MMKVIRKRRYISQSVAREFHDIVRGASGGFLFGIPLLYTMEVWWIGSYTSPPLMLVTLATTFIVVFFLNSTEGFRQTKRVEFTDTLMDSVQVLAIGLVCATIVLILLGEINFSTSLEESLGKLTLESVPFSLGGALARAFLSGDRWSNSDGETLETTHNNHKKNSLSPVRATLSDIGVTFIGSIIIGFNIAPTDEVDMLSATASPPWLLAFITASLLISYGIVFEAGFTTQKKRRQQPGFFQRPLSETIMSYLVSLIAAALMLSFFHRLSFNDPWTLWLSSTIILGLPTTIGGAAGRLAA